jgi:pimeloyl-CoA synthetase
MVNIKPKEIMNWIAGRKIDHTNWKTIQIANLDWQYKTKSKQSLREKAWHLRKQISAIDKKLEQRYGEDHRAWLQRLYLRFHNAINRTDYLDE